MQLMIAGIVLSSHLVSNCHGFRAPLPLATGKCHYGIQWHMPLLSRWPNFTFVRLFYINKPKYCNKKLNEEVRQLRRSSILSRVVPTWQQRRQVDKVHRIPIYVDFFAFYIRDNSGGECIAWLNDAHHDEQELCDQRLNAVCQRSIYYAGKWVQCMNGIFEGKYQSHWVGRKGNEYLGPTL